MKFRIIKDGFDTYSVQEKSWCLSPWITVQNSIKLREQAELALNDQIKRNTVKVVKVIKV